MTSCDSETIDATAKTVLISQNPKSGSSNRRILIDSLSEELTRNGLEVEIIQDVDELCSAANEHFESATLRTVVSAGGDGTASLLVNRLPIGVPITVLPLGTANLLAKYLDAPLDIESVTKNVVAGRTITLDVGRANDRIFLVVASCGFDADVVKRIHSARKGHISYWSYGIPIVNSIRNYRFPKMRLEVDGKKLKSARWAFVFNIPQYAMDLKLVENADAQDGLLDICTFKDGGFLTGLYYFFSILLRRHKRIRATNIKQFKVLIAESNEQVPIELDGDPAGHLPVTIQVMPNRLKVVVSQEWIRNQTGATSTV